MRALILTLTTATGAICSSVLNGFHLIDVAEREDRRGVSLRVVVESPPRQEGCRVCGVIAHSHGRRTVRLVDAPCMGRPVEVVWRKRTWAPMDGLVILLVIPPAVTRQVRKALAGRPR